MGSVSCADTGDQREYENSIGKTCPETYEKGQHDCTYFWCHCTSYAAFRLARAGINTSDFTYNLYRGQSSAESWPKNAEEKDSYG